MSTEAQLKEQADCAKIEMVRARMERRLAEECRKRREKACRRSGGHVYALGSTEYPDCMVCEYHRHHSYD